MSVLLLGPDDYGTLAAVRCFARNGVRVSVAGEDRRGRALFSRYADERLVHPPLSAPAALTEWLLDWADQHPGAFIYPSNDDLAWFLALRRDDLRGAFRMLSPSEETIVTLLDKLRLIAACAEVGIETPRTVPLGDARADEVALGIADLGFPVLLKPRARIRLRGGVKGFIVRDLAALPSALARLRELVTFDPAFTELRPEAAEPLAQEYLSLAETRILSLAGFVGDDGECVALASMKTLQRPRKLGIGVCFEARAVEPSLVEKVALLCRRVGYRGVFEVEFVVVGDRRLLIDFNPRYYSQMGFEISRGLQLPLIAWRAARGEKPAIPAHPPHAQPDGEIYCHKPMLDLLLVLQGLSGAMSRDEMRAWRDWHARARRAGRATDAVRDPADRLPAVADGARWAAGFARHPRSFVNDFVLNR